VKTVAAIFDRLRAGERAVRGVRDAGVPPEQINLVAAISDPRSHDMSEEDVEDVHVPTPAESIATAAGISNLIAGLAFLSIPALGPVLAAGPLMAGMATGGVTATRESLLEALESAGVPREDAERYAEAVREGGTLVLATVPDNAVDRVVRALDHQVPRDLDDVPPLPASAEQPELIV
jgi:hypothetical protein